MKKVYEKPMMMCDVFSADEYVAACGDENMVYLFECNESPGVIGNVYKESNGEPGLQLDEFTSSNIISGSYRNCGIHHEFQPENVNKLIDGYVVKYTENSGILPDSVHVKVWRGEDGNNCHCTSKVDVSTWTTTKS